MKRTGCFLLLLYAGLVFSGCKESVTSTGTPGEIAGFVQLYNSDNYNDLSADNSGVTVTLPGTSLSAISDRSGRWILSNVPPGIYKIFFSKDGYTSWEDFNIEFIGNGTYYYSPKNSTIDLYPLPALTPDIVLRPFNDSLEIRDTILIDSLGYEYYPQDTTIIKNENTLFSSRSQFQYEGNSVETAILFGKNPEIDPMNPSTYLYITDFTYNHQWPDSSGIATINIHRSTLINAGFHSGDKIYCCAFATIDLLIWRGAWFDPGYNQNIYACFSPHHSEVRSFVLP